jgi:hypothetical protein
MQYLHTNRTARESLRIVFDGQVVFLPLRDHATLADIALAVRGFDARRYGEPVAIDITMRDIRTRPQAFESMPSYLKFEDDPAAERDLAVSPGARFSSPDRVRRLNS